jgi:hypothetical protein
MLEEDLGLTVCLLLFAVWRQEASLATKGPGQQQATHQQGLACLWGLGNLAGTQDIILSKVADSVKKMEALVTHHAGRVSTQNMCAHNSSGCYSRGIVECVQCSCWCMLA